MESNTQCDGEGLVRVATLIASTTCQRKAGNRKSPSTGLAPWQLRRVLAYIETHLLVSLSVSALAEAVCLSKAHFSRTFTLRVGKTPMQFVMHRRLERVCGELSGTREPISQIALSCGFCDQAHLSRVFRRVFGITPGAWRKRSWVRESKNRAPESRVAVVR